MTGKHILVVDDEEKMRRVLEIALTQQGHRVSGAGDGKEALKVFGDSSIDLVIADLRMPEMGGLELLMALRRLQADVPVIVVTAHGTIETAIAAMKNGAFDYVLRPFDMDVLFLAVNRALGSVVIARQNAYLRKEANRGWDAFVGTSPPMQALYELIQRAGPSKASVLVSGETGTGKELAARALHNASPRREQLFVAINCAAIPADLLEGELFGHEKGAFTGAQKDRVGKFELADGGTLFLDEITEMPIALQAKLLRVLQESAIERLGSNRSIPLDLRVVATTNRDALEAVRSGKLREDLYYRINVVALKLPTLRERPSDIALLVRHFIEKYRGRSEHGDLTAAVLRRLEEYAWPGNVRELENFVERATILSSGDRIEFENFVPSAVAMPGVETSGRENSSGAGGSLDEEVETLEKRLIGEALRNASGSKPKAAAALGISERTLWYKLKKLKIAQES
jgi:two-component system response regulator AtoC